MSERNPKQIYTREDLTRNKTGRWGWTIKVCALCEGRSIEGDRLFEIKHDKACPLAWSAVLAIKGVALTAPDKDICGQCPAGLTTATAEEANCPAGDWNASTHQELQEKCMRYAADVWEKRQR